MAGADAPEVVARGTEHAEEAKEEVADPVREDTVEEIADPVRGAEMWQARVAKKMRISQSH